MAKFQLYRYQLLPIDRHTTDLFEGLTTEQLIEQKNEIFSKALGFVRDHRHRGKNLAVKIQENADRDAFLLGIAPNRTLVRETEEFVKEAVSNWPRVTSIVLNRPDEQLILVQERVAAFSSTKTVINLICNATRQSLERAGLTLVVQPLFDEREFWSLVRQNRNMITWVDFEFVTPNMANISGSLKDALKSLAKDTNSTQSNLQLRSNPNSSLDLDASSDVVKGLVEYSSLGGGNISLKVRGVKKRITTSDAVSEVEFTDIELHGQPDQVVNTIRDLLR